MYLEGKEVTGFIFQFYNLVPGMMARCGGMTAASVRNRQ